MSQKSEVLKRLMNEKGYDYYLVPSIDNHNNEYVPPCWQYRVWISEFDGSAGDVLITQDISFLSTDGRYFTQAEYQLDSKGFSLLKQKGYDSEIENWLIKNFKGKTLAVDPKKISIARAENLLKLAEQYDAKVVFDTDNLVAKAQEELNQTQAVPMNKVFLHEIQYTGQSVESKLNTIRKELKEENQNALVVSSLDAVMWSLNIRGRDIKNTPVAICYLVITLSDAYIYIDSQKVDDEVKEYFLANKITMKTYEQFFVDLAEYEANYLLDVRSANYAMKEAIMQNKYSKVLIAESSITLSKALKNSMEINGAKDAHKKDAVAFIKWWWWMENNYQGLNEIQAGAKLQEFRAEQKRLCRR